MKQLIPNTGFRVFLLITVIFLIPVSILAQRVIFTLPGISSTIAVVPGRPSSLNARSFSLPFKTVHLAEEARLTEEVYDQKINLAVITREIDDASNNFLTAAKSGQVFPEMTIESVYTFRTELRTVAKYVLHDVVVQSVDISFGSGGELPVESISFAFSAFEYTFFYVDPRTGNLISSRSTRVLAEADSRKR